MRRIATIVIIMLIILISIGFIFNDFRLSSDNEDTNTSFEVGLVPDEFTSNSLARGVGNNKFTLLTDGEGSSVNNNFGFALTSVGNLNSDGFDDIIICAPYASPLGKNNAGEAYIFFGAEDFAIKELDAARADVKISGSNAGELFGTSICMPGDINNDDINDIVIGAPGAAGEIGKIYVFYSNTLTSGLNISTTSADLVLQGSSETELFGMAITAIGDVNSDQINDIMVGAPGGDKAYILYGPTFGTSERTVLVGPKGSAFGTAISGGTDLNNDGHLDFVVGAPVATAASGGKSQLFLYFGYKNFYLNSIVTVENNTLISNSADSLFGQCLNSQIDIDNDGFYDLVVGAPGEDSVFIYYGNTLTEKFSYPYLWNMPGDAAQPVDFTSGVYNDVGSNLDVNTYGLGQGDDGWDWGPNMFGTSVGRDMDFIYGAWESTSPPYADADGLDYGNKSRLEVVVGRSNTQPGPTWNWWQDSNADSGAWGIEFTISPKMYENISNGAGVYLEFDWEAHDAMSVFGNNGGTEERCYVKARFSSSTTSTFLGTDIGGDSAAELFYSESSSMLSSPFSSAKEHFKSNINHLFDSDGNYYVELGARLEATRSSNKGGTEGIVAFFDNISIYIETLPIAHSVKIRGITQSKFGQSMAVLNDLNGDGFDEIAIGAPYSNLAGINSGALYIFYGSSGLHSQINTNEAQKILSGFNDNENFGLIFGDAGNVNGDAYNELIVAAPGYSNSLGKIYVFSPCQKPEISMVNPSGGIIVEGELEIIASAFDYENELDKFGVSFYYSEYEKDKPEAWKLISQVKIPNENTRRDQNTSYQYCYKWNTTEVTDGLYYMKAAVKDNTYLTSEALSELFEINNPDRPVVEIISPKLEDTTYTGLMTLRAKCTDPDGDLNFTIFYYSQDTENWEYIGIDYIGEDSVYQLEWDTEDVYDGNYVIMVRSNDSRGLSTQEVSVRFNIHNPGAPTIGFIQPSVNDTLKGYTLLKVFVNDKDDNIASPGVTFSYSRDRNEWVVIDSVSVVNLDSSYSTYWDTLKIQDGYYYLKAYVIDTTNLSAEVILGPIRIDNPSPPAIQIEPLSAPLSGKVKLKAICFDEDNDLSSEGVTFSVSTDNENWLELGKIPLARGILSGQNTIFELEWDTTTAETPDNPNYKIRATIKDITSLKNESVIGPFEVNNPDPPTINLDHPKAGNKLTGKVMLGAYAQDPDNDIDARGVSFYFSLDGENWYLIDNAYEPVQNSSLYQFEWDTTKLPNGDYHLKAEVVDLKALKAESVIKIKINNGSEQGLLNVSSNYWAGSIFFIIIIILLMIFLVSSIIRQRKKREEDKAKEDREELVKSIREELIREQMRYPVLQVSPTTAKEIPVLPASTAQAATGTATGPGAFPLLPPHQPPTPGTMKSAAATPVGQPQPVPVAQAGPSAQTPTVNKLDQSQPKIGLTPEEMPVATATASAQVPTMAKTQADKTTPTVQLPQQPQPTTIPSTEPKPTPIQPTPAPSPAPQPTPSPTPKSTPTTTTTPTTTSNSTPTPSIMKPGTEKPIYDNQEGETKPLIKKVEDKPGGDEA
ncbi:Ig-like domain-containing protein [[Eubacterium] cellulosolvens]